MLGHPYGDGRCVVRDAAAPVLTACAVLVLALFGTADAEAATKLKRVSFRDLPGWQQDAVAPALPALRASCDVLDGKPSAAPVGPAAMGGKAEDWRAPCKALRAAGSGKALRQALETWFVPFAVSDADGPEGLFTGYYEPELRGSRTPSAAYSVRMVSANSSPVIVQLSLARPTTTRDFSRW